MKNFDNQLQALIAKINKKIDAVPQFIAETAHEHFRNAINKGQWDGKPYEPYKGKEPARGKLMRRSGALFGSIIIASVTPEHIVISAGNSKVPYARIHNEGGTIQRKPRSTIVTHKIHSRGKFKGRTLFARNNERASYSRRVNIGAYNINMPQRQFMGKSAGLLKEIKQLFHIHFKTL